MDLAATNKHVRLARAELPASEYIAIEDLAKVIGISEALVRSLFKVEGAAVKYTNIYSVLEPLIKNRKKTQEFLEAQKNKAVNEAKLSQIAIDTAEGKLIDREETELSLSSMFSQIRDQIGNFPLRLQREGVLNEKQAELLRKESDRFLRALAGDVKELLQDKVNAVLDGRSKSPGKEGKGRPKRTDVIVPKPVSKVEAAKARAKRRKKAK